MVFCFLSNKSGTSNQRSVAYLTVQMYLFVTYIMVFIRNKRVWKSQVYCHFHIMLFNFAAFHWPLKLKTNSQLPFLITQLKRLHWLILILKGGGCKRREQLNCHQRSKFCLCPYSKITMIRQGMRSSLVRSTYSNFKLDLYDKNNIQKN